MAQQEQGRPAGSLVRRRPRPYVSGAMDGAVPALRTFTMNASRAPALAWGLVLATLVEGLALHLVLGAEHRTAAGVATAVAALASAWVLARDRAGAARAGRRRRARAARRDAPDGARAVGAGRRGGARRRVA